MEFLEKRFESMGARVRFAPLASGDLRIDIRTDRHGEFFEVRKNSLRVHDLLALEVDRQNRHLLLFAKTEDEKGEVRRQRFLCGHDERAWFVAAVPGKASSIVAAKEALKPPIVRAMQERRHVRVQDRQRRKTKAYVRQGEWFFLPRPDVKTIKGVILNDEPIRRGQGKPHLCEYLARSGGELVYVSREFRSGVTAGQYVKLLKRNPKLKKLNWQQMRRNMTVFVKGRIRHPDHKTVVLRTWHEVVMNTEWQAPAMRSVAFLD